MEVYDGICTSMKYMGVLVKHTSGRSGCVESGGGREGSTDGRINGQTNGRTDSLTNKSFRAHLS